jgi:formylglycine-generating enzyme required for sulfatase activity
MENIGGNVWDWVDAFTYDNYPVANNWSFWKACTTPDGICGNTLATNDQRYGANATSLYAVQRGGNYVMSYNGGPFLIILSRLPSTTAAGGVGFRCAR